jgi:hypothetical protein
MRRIQKRINKKKPKRRRRRKRFMDSSDEEEEAQEKPTIFNTDESRMFYSERYKKTLDL